MSKAPPARFDEDRIPVEKDKVKEKSSKKSKKSKKSHKKRYACMDVYNVGPLNESDFFSRSPEFRVWLGMAKKEIFGDLTSEAQRERFKEFIELWNDAKLPKTVYDGVSADLSATVPRTSHKWSFNLSEKDKVSLQEVKDSTIAQTVGGTSDPFGARSQREDEDKERIEKAARGELYSSRKKP